MENLRLVRSNRWLLTLPVSLGIALVFLWLLPISSLVRGSGGPAIVSARARERTASLSNSSVITIGVSSWLSGPGVIGWTLANSVQMAINQTNAAGGINVGGITHTLALVTADDGCNISQAITAADTMLNAGAVAVVAHACSSASMAAQPIYNAAGVAMISPTSSSPQLTQQGYNTTFRTITHDTSPANHMATYFHNFLGFSKSAIVESWWTAPGDAYSSTFTTLGGTITSRRVVSDTSYITTTLSVIQSENPDVIVNFYTNPDYVTAGGLLSKIAHNLGMTSVVIGWNSDSNDASVLVTYANSAGPMAAENDYAAMTGVPLEEMPGWTNFLAAYQASNFPNEPDDPGPFGPYAYDAAGIIIAAIDRADSTDPLAIRNQIAATKDYAGVVGSYQGFDANGDVIPQRVWLERYQDGQWLRFYPGKIFLPIILR